METMTPKSKKPCPCCQKAIDEILKHSDDLMELRITKLKYAAKRETASFCAGLNLAAAIVSKHGKLSEK